MESSNKIHDLLNDAISNEMNSIRHYVVQHVVQDSWGYHALAATTMARAIEEMKHARCLIERLVFLQGTPELEANEPLSISATVKDQFEKALIEERDGAENLNEWIDVCGNEGDHGTGALLGDILKDEERHVAYLDSQLHVIEETGLASYLSEQLGKREP